MQLVSARVGLTNYYHQQVIRNPVMDIDSTIIDKLTDENLNGGISKSTLMMASVFSGGLNAVASGFANIMGGWNESKGLMKLDFIVQDSPVAIEKLHVIGYVTNNGSTEGLTTDAVFTPAMSWKSHETITGSLNLANPTTTHRQIGGRTDYILNDGSQLTDLVSMRPNDVIDFSIEKASHQDILDKMNDEGLDGIIPQIGVAGTEVSRVGVITSKRNNINPSSYAGDILAAGTGFQRNNRISSNMVDTSGENLSEFDGMFNQLATLSYATGNKEPQLLRDDFFRSMMDVMGQASLRGFTGYSIGDLQCAFENINDVLDVTFMDRSQFGVSDFTQSTESMGTSQTEEFVSQEITMNVLDLLIKYGLSSLNFRGSNCDHFGGDGGLSNVVILPYNPFSLEDDDFDTGNKVEGFVEELTNQIFAKLNGIRSSDLTPIRFDVSVELFGTCVINLQRVNSNNNTTGFNLQDTGIPDGMQSRVYPTFALNNFAPTVGDKQQAQQAGSNFFTNLETYFK